jgi:hypothetical protein
VSPASDGCEEPVNPDRRMESRRAGAGAVVTQCTFIQITTAITPKDPMTVRTTKQRSKKIHLIRWCGFWRHRKPLPLKKAADQLRQRDWNI